MPPLVFSLLMLLSVPFPWMGKGLDRQFDLNLLMPPLSPKGGQQLMNSSGTIR
jgi:hypothetical protein